MRNRTEVEQEPLVIDRAAAAEIPSQDAVREWAHGRRAFISSVMSELPAERQAAAGAVRAVGVAPVMFEQFGGRDADELLESRQRVAATSPTPPSPAASSSSVSTPSAASPPPNARRRSRSRRSGAKKEGASSREPAPS